MRKLIPLLFALAPLTSQADLLFTVGAQASVWDADTGGHLDRQLAVDADGMDLDTETSRQLSLFIEHPLPLLPNVRLRDTQLDLSGDSDLSASFLGQDFDEPVHSQLDLSHSDLTLYWGLPVPLVDINFGMTGRQFNGKAVVANGMGKTSSADIDMVLPMAYAGVRFDAPFGLYAMADANYVAYSGNSLSDITYGIGYDLPIPLPMVDIGLEAGYRSLRLQADDGWADLDTDVDVSGAWYGASVEVGL